MKFCKFQLLEMLCEAFGKHSFSQTSFIFNDKNVSKTGQVSIQDDKHLRSPITSKNVRKCTSL